jgi:hypothetical protein
MAKKKPAKQDVNQETPTEGSETPSSLERAAQQMAEEAVERARGELRMRRQLETTILGVDPDAGPEERARARRELAKELGLDPEDPSLVERAAHRAEEEAIDRGSEEFRARRGLAEALEVEPEPSPEGSGEEGGQADEPVS